MHYRRVLTLSFLLSFGWAGAMKANGFDCSGTTTGLETEICKDTELSELAALAGVVGTVVGLDVRYSALNYDEDFGLSSGVRRLLSSLTLSEIETLVDLSHGLAWDLVFDDVHNILLINAKQRYAQGGLVVFAPSAQSTSTPIYVEMEHVFDAVRYRYRLVGNILEVISWARPSESTEKFRFQEGCWRLIGEDRLWANYMVEFNDDLVAISVNHLTGLAILDFKEEKGVERRFTPQVGCLDKKFNFYEIEYQDADGK
jgi:hypothetical protein